MLNLSRFRGFSKLTIYSTKSRQALFQEEKRFF